MDTLYGNPFLIAMSLEIREWPGEWPGDWLVGERLLSRACIAVDARWSGGDGVDASEPEVGVIYNDLRARVRFPSIVCLLLAKALEHRNTGPRSLPSASSSRLRESPLLFDLAKWWSKWTACRCYRCSERPASAAAR